MDPDLKSQLFAAALFGLPLLMIVGAMIADPDLVYKNSGWKFFRSDEEIDRISRRTTLRQKRIRIALVAIPAAFLMLGSFCPPVSLLPILFLIIYLLTVAARIVRRMIRG